MRERAALLAAEIPRDLPDYTVHDISHIDGLWAMASLIAGEDYELTPCEAFLLGGAFLIHDLGMSIAAYPDGVDAFRSNDVWRDAVVVELRESIGHYPSEEEMAAVPAEIVRRADAVALRVLHPRQAEALAVASWPHPDTGEPLFLLHDPELKDSMAALIGRIAHSHWCAVDELGECLGSVRVGPPMGMPVEWTMDPVLVACLLRAADAAHLHAERAPLFLRALRKPEGLARDHWLFQSRLHQPIPESDRLAFTAVNPFCESDAQAWWLCYDSLRVVDRELRQIDQLLADTMRRPFRLKGVAGAEDPQRLAAFVCVEAWEPVEARVRVSDVEGIVERLGGAALYGNKPSVAIRELVQNSADAVRALRAIDGRAADWGSINVEIGGDASGPWIEVSDNGIGMSRSVLTGALLDFGTSYWRSRSVHEDLPGLFSAGFRPSGRFGIGFFSIFMLGGRACVRTRRYDKSRRDTLVLDLCRGVDRPLLRRAAPDEELRDPGTAVRVWLEGAAAAALGKVESAAELADRLAAQFPALDVGLHAKMGSERVCAVSCSDWTRIEPHKLLTRLSGGDWGKGPNLRRRSAFPANMITNLLTADGRLVGRAAIDPQLTYYVGEAALNALVEDGIVVCRLLHMAGILLGQATTLSRDGEGIAAAGVGDIARWASGQARLFAASVVHSDPQAMEIAALVDAFGGDPGPLPIGLMDNADLLTEEESRPIYIGELSSIPWPDRLALMSDDDLVTLQDCARDEVPDVPVIRTLCDVPQVFPNSGQLRGQHWKYQGVTEGSHAARILDAIGTAWGFPPEDGGPYIDQRVVIGNDFDHEKFEVSIIFLDRRKGAG